MDNEKYTSEEEMEPLRRKESTSAHSRTSIDSASTASVSFALLDALNSNHRGDRTGRGHKPKDDIDDGRYRDDDELDLEDGDYLPENKESGKKFRRALWIFGLLCLSGWILTFIVFWTQGKPESEEKEETSGISSVDSQEPLSTAFGKKITLEQILNGKWSPQSHSISWISGPDGEDGLILEKNGGYEEAYLRVEDIRNRGEGDDKGNSSRVLMQESGFRIDGNMLHPSQVWPSPDLKKVLAMTAQEKNWRHSYTGKYWLFDVDTQTAEPLDPDQPDGRIQLASWSPESDAVVFTRDNNMFLRSLQKDNVQQITSDGGVDLFYGIPDWVYEEEVFSTNSATWWAEDGKHIAFLQTDESAVPEFPVQYFLSRPSGETPPPDEENYPDVRQIKYPKAGAPNPTVNLQFYDVESRETFSVEVAGTFSDDDRLIIEVVWTSPDKVLVRETNRESDILKIILVDMASRTGEVVRSEDIAALDGGWVEPGHFTNYIPADLDQGRPQDGYVDIVIHDGNNHLAYFSSLNSSEPIMLTSGDWEVANGPSAVDINAGLVYFVGTKEDPTQRHVYSVKLDGSDMQALTNTDAPGYYDASFSAGAGYALLSYKGPKIPSQKVISTPSNDDEFEEIIEENKALANMAKEYAIPTEIYQDVTVDGFTLPVVERRPPYFNAAKKYPVLFFLYGGPGSQTVDRKFSVDFQSYVASTLGYIVVTVDGRGTGYNGRKSRCIIRDNIGHYEARDQIETAKIWGKRKYVDANRMAIWGWSYGGYMTLKTLEQDAGETFQYGMAVAPVTNWSFYGKLCMSPVTTVIFLSSHRTLDSIYTERYMHTPQNNPSGYENSSISDMGALGSNVRFLVMHGVSDDNVHMQNSLALIDNLDLAGIENYDVHVFPDSDHSIYFHNARQMVYGRKFSSVYCPCRSPFSLTNPFYSNRAVELAC